MSGAAGAVPENGRAIHKILAVNGQREARRSDGRGGNGGDARQHVGEHARHEPRDEHDARRPKEPGAKEMTGTSDGSEGADLLDDDQLNRLPDAPSVIYMAGMKFGAGVVFGVAT